MALITEVPGSREDYKVWFSGDGRDGVYVIARPEAGLTFEEGQRSAVPLKEGEKIIFLGSGERGKVEGDKLVIEGSEPAALRRIKALEAENARLREALAECADDLECEVNARYEFLRGYPTYERKREGELEPVRKARAALKGDSDG